MISTLVLDTTRGKPAAAVPVVLARRDGNEWRIVGRGETDADGRLTTLTPPGELPAGLYRLAFDTGTYFRERYTETFFPEVTVTFAVGDGKQNYHVPLLISPFGYSTYRGA